MSARHDSFSRLRIQVAVMQEAIRRLEEQQETHSCQIKSLQMSAPKYLPGYDGAKR